MSDSEVVPLEQYVALLARAEAAEAEAADLRRVLDAAFGASPSNVRPQEDEMVEIILNGYSIGLKGFVAELHDSGRPLFIPALYVRGWRPQWAAGWDAADCYPVTVFPPRPRRRYGDEVAPTEVS